MSGAPVCAFCRTRPVDAMWRPFCSERCKLQDLARWADGSYRIPGEPLADPDDEHETGDAGHGRQK